MPTESDGHCELESRVRGHLCLVAAEAKTITYQVLAKALGLTPPNTIHQLVLVLERLMEEDAANANPLIAALVVSRFRGGIPAPGFFDFARHIGRYDGASSGQDAIAFHTKELNTATAFWCETISE